MTDREINVGHYFEIMDRIHVIQCTIEDHIRDHVAMTEEQRGKIDAAQALLGEVYQWAGAQGGAIA